MKKFWRQLNKKGVLTDKCGRMSIIFYKIVFNLALFYSSLLLFLIIYFKASTLCKGHNCKALFLNAN